MKSKNIPDDIRRKSIKEAQNEIKQIIEKLDNTETNLEESMESYTRMMHLNNHIQYYLLNHLQLGWHLTC